MDPFAQVERGVPASWSERRNRYVAVIVVLIVLALGIGVVAYISIEKLSDVRAAEDRNACSDRLIGYAFDTAALTLGAPPAPSAARVATANDFVRAAHRLSNADVVCAHSHNTPRPLPPTPVDK